LQVVSQTAEDLDPKDWAETYKFETRVRSSTKVQHRKLVFIEWIQLVETEVSWLMQIKLLLH
jgi:hypothetical protein